MTKEQKEYIFAEYVKGVKTYREIASDVGLASGTIRSFVSQKVASGELERVDRIAFIKQRAEERRAKAKKEEKKRKVTHLSDGTVDVDCDKYHNTCIYGCSMVGKCNFQACVGRSRILTSPDHKHCHEYVKITKDRPRITQNANGIWE